MPLLYTMVIEAVWIDVWKEHVWKDEILVDHFILFIVLRGLDHLFLVLVSD